MKGTEKQIASAVKIKETALSVVDHCKQITKKELFDKYNPYRRETSEIEKEINFIDALKKRIEIEESATWFLNNSNALTTHHIDSIKKISL